MRTADRGELRALGLEVSRGRRGRRRPARDAGNLLDADPGGGPDASSILLCAHLDTVPLAAPVEPVLVNGGWENANEAILGADNKAAVAIMPRARAPAASAPQPPPVGVELLFTVCEEVSLQGSRAFDISRLRSAFGYVFDHATPVGEVVVASPTHYRIIAELHGRAAHAGVRPESGPQRDRRRRARDRGDAARPDRRRRRPRTSARSRAARRSTSSPSAAASSARSAASTTARAAAVATEMIDHLQDAADAQECDLDLDVEQMFHGYRVKPWITSSPWRRAPRAPRDAFRAMVDG